jgi:catechol 2,3-dioxygenase-like lactoylglutathione lyase family enzyme
MGVNHIALAVKDIEKTHEFYTKAMGFELVKVEVVPQKSGVARHAFYSTGPKRDQLMAFWDLSGVPEMKDLKTDISRDLGLDPLTNHLAFSADDLADLERRKERWLDYGRNVLEIDHHWVHSIYTDDPDGITVEFAVVTKDFTAEDAVEAERLLHLENPPLVGEPPIVKYHKAEVRRADAERSAD